MPPFQSSRPSSRPSDANHNLQHLNRYGRCRWSGLLDCQPPGPGQVHHRIRDERSPLRRQNHLERNARVDWQRPADSRRRPRGPSLPCSSEGRSGTPTQGEDHRVRRDRHNRTMGPFHTHARRSRRYPSRWSLRDALPFFSCRSSFVRESGGVSELAGLVNQRACHISHDLARPDSVARRRKGPMVTSRTATPMPKSPAPRSIHSALRVAKNS